MKTKIALMYDFDHTLCTRDMQEYGFIPDLGMSCDQFWAEVTNQTHTKHMDAILSYLYYMKVKATEKGYPLTKPHLQQLGQDVEFFPGVMEWFDRITKFGKENNVEIEHYIISSGLREIIKGCKIAHNFKEIYASQFHYDENGNADWPAMAVNFTNKTQFFFRIHKGTLDISNDRINEAVPEEEIYVPYANMIYLGDGLTDVPCMSLAKKYGGNSIAVYDSNSEATKKLLDDDRVNFTAKADYREGKDLDKIIKTIIRSIALNASLSRMQKKEQLCLEEDKCENAD